MESTPSNRDKFAALGQHISETFGINRTAKRRQAEPPEATAASQLQAPPAGDSVEVLDVSLDKVIDSPFQPRQRPITKKEVEELMRSISATGQTAPVILAPADGDNEGKLYVHSGHRRCAALRFLGAPTVRAIVRRDLDERGAQKLALADNLGREDLTAYEQALALKRYCESFGLTVEAGGAELGLGRRTAYRLNSVAAASEALLEVMRARGLPLCAAELLAKLDVKAPRKAMRLAERYAGGAVSLAQLEAHVRSASGAGRAGAARAVKDVRWQASVRQLALEVKLDPEHFTEAQIARVKEAIAQLLGHLRIPMVEAVAVERFGGVAAEAEMEGTEAGI